MSVLITDRTAGFDGGSTRRAETSLLCGTSEGPRRARERVRDVCAAWGVGEDSREALLLVVSELVTNAVRHAEGSVVLAMDKSPEGVTVLVTDGSPCRAPVSGRSSTTQECGRGLPLVEALSDDCGWCAYEDHKVVWATVGSKGEET
jgi:anti-sigma regulatory factor (Ser/Thr protein kinase)